MSEDNSKDEEDKVEEPKASAESTAVETKEDEIPETAASACLLYTSPSPRD